MDASNSPTRLGVAEPGRRPTRPLPGRSVPKPRRAPAAARPMPQRSEHYDHLTLPALRAYRDALQGEEDNVSYWRRILQARLDVVRAGRVGGGTAALGPERLRPVLTDARVGAGRSALVRVLPVDDIPPLPRLGELWERSVDTADVEGLQKLEQDLAEAEEQLSAYRAALHRRLADATAELIARYRAEPVLSLCALPRERRGA